MTDKQIVDVLKAFADCDNTDDCHDCRNIENVCCDEMANRIFFVEAARRFEVLSQKAIGKALSMNEYQQKAARTINKKLTPEKMLDHALHEIASEVGEIHGLYQKELQGHEFSVEKLKKEIGDLLWGIAELCEVYGFTLEEVARMNNAKLENRYPEGFTEERSIHREGTED